MTEKSDPVGKPLHVQVAEMVFGAKGEIHDLAPRGYPEPTWCYEVQPQDPCCVVIPRYDEDMNEAAKVIEKMFALGYPMMMMTDNEQGSPSPGGCPVTCLFDPQEEDGVARVVVGTMPAAICKAALARLRKDRVEPLDSMPTEINIANGDARVQYE